MEFLLLTETSSWLLLSPMKVCTYVFLRVLNFFFNGRKVLVNDFDDDQIKSAAALLGNVKADDYKQNTSSNDEEEICMEELITVMDRLGLELLMETAGENGEENWRKKSYSMNELEAILFDDEDQEPSLLEIKEAFDVFDDNKDGYIDATELQRILRVLYNTRAGEEEYDLEKCGGMLCAFDKNGDGLIDFPEFVKFMGEALMK